MSDALTRTELLKSHLKELMKSYYEYDGLSRLSKVFDAHIDTVHNSPCLITEYEYEGATARITKRKEYYGTWDSSYEI
jgi:hypothetical protein